MNKPETLELLQREVPFAQQSIREWTQLGEIQPLANRLNELRFLNFRFDESFYMKALVDQLTPEVYRQLLEKHIEEVACGGLPPATKYLKDNTIQLRSSAEVIKFFSLDQERLNSLAFESFGWRDYLDREEKAYKSYERFGIIRGEFNNLANYVIARYPLLREYREGLAQEATLRWIVENGLGLIQGRKPIRKFLAGAEKEGRYGIANEPPQHPQLSPEYILDANSVGYIPFEKV